MKTLLVVDGIDGSGKSTFARRLLADLGAAECPGVIVSIDDFRRPVRWGAVTVPEVEVYYDGYYDLALADATLRSFVAGAPVVTIPNYDVMSEQIVGTRDLTFAGADVAIVEGVFPLRVPAVTDALHVFLEVSADEARQRIISRDIKKNRTREETERRIDRRYVPAQARYHEAFVPRTRADVLIDNATPMAPVVLRRQLSRAPEPVRALLDRLLPAC